MTNSIDNIHRQTKIDGVNAIISLTHNKGNSFVDVLLCTSSWSPVESQRVLTSDNKSIAIELVKSRYKIDMSLLHQ